MASTSDEIERLRRDNLTLKEAEEKTYARVRQLEREGLPKIDPIMKGRFWPAVDAFFRARAGLGNTVPSEPDGEEHWDAA